MLIILTLAIFAVVAVAVFSLAAAWDERHSQARLMKERLAAVERAAERNPSEELALLRDELLSEIPSLNRLLRRSNHVTRLQRMLSQADVRVRAGKFLLISCCVGSVLGLVVLQLTRSILPAGLLAIGGALIPLSYVMLLRSRRFHKFETLFPEAIDLLVRATRAGHAFTTALELIGDELAEPVSGEFRKVFEEQKFGLPTRDALLNLAERVPLVDVKFFVITIMLQRETGGNLAEILDKLSYVIRERFKILRQVKVYTAQGRLTMGLLMALPPALVIAMAVMNPDFIRPLFTDSIGHKLIMIAIVLQTIGFFLIRRIIHIKV